MTDMFMVEKNMSEAEQIIRTVIGIIILFAGYTYLTGVIQLLSYVVGAVLVITGLTGYCPVYSFFKK